MNSLVYVWDLINLSVLRISSIQSNIDNIHYHCRATSEIYKNVLFLHRWPFVPFEQYPSPSASPCDHYSLLLCPPLFGLWVLVNCMVFVFRCLPYSTYHNALPLHPCCCPRQEFPSCLWPDNIPLFTYTITLIHLSVYEQLGCCHNLPVVNSAADILFRGWFYF